MSATGHENYHVGCVPDFNFTSLDVRVLHAAGLDRNAARRGEREPHEVTAPRARHVVSRFLAWFYFNIFLNI